MIVLAYVHSIALRGYFLQFMIGYSPSRAKDQPVTLRRKPNEVDNRIRLRNSETNKSYVNRANK